MKVGSLVELVDDDWIWQSNPIFINIYPVKGNIYTVREIRKGVYSSHAILLEEIINKKYPYANGFSEKGFSMDKFRELQPPIANIEKQINENTLEPVLK